MAIDRQIIKAYNNKIIGFIDTDQFGNKIVKDKYNKIVGRYDKRVNVTRDAMNKIVAYGDQVTMLLNYK